MPCLTVPAAQLRMEEPASMRPPPESGGYRTGDYGRKKSWRRFNEAAARKRRIQVPIEGSYYGHILLQ